MKAVLVKALLDSISGEIAAIDLYTALEGNLRSEGLIEEADIVLEILNDEKDHLNKFQAMLRRWRGQVE